MRKDFGSTSANIFERAGVALLSRSTRCRILKEKANPSPDPQRKTRCLGTEMMTNFLLFANETRATLDGPDVWAKAWVLLRRQQGDGGIVLGMAS